MQGLWGRPNISRAPLVWCLSFPTGLTALPPDPALASAGASVTGPCMGSLATGWIPTRDGLDHWTQVLGTL